jgi:hypothetical protein
VVSFGLYILQTGKKRLQFVLFQKNQPAKYEQSESVPLVLNPNSYSTGNPLLTPSYINNYELGYTYNNKLSASIYYLRLKNAFGQVSSLDLVSQTGTYLNYYNNSFYGANLSYTDSFFKFWETSFSMNASYQTSEVFNIEADTFDGYSVSYSWNNTFFLNKNKTVAVFLNYEHQLPYRNVAYHFKNFMEMSSGIKISLMEKQLQINATVNNIFAMRYKADIYFRDSQQSFNNYWDGRAFRLSELHIWEQEKTNPEKGHQF